MKRCAACGGEIGENVKYCPLCGACVRESEEIRDYWAEQLSEAGEEDWTAESYEEELADLNDPQEEEAEIRALMNQVKPRKKSKVPAVILAICIVLSAAVLILGFLLRYKGKVTPIPGSGMYYGCTSTLDGNTERNAGDYVELRPDGTCRISLMDVMTEGKWRLQNGYFEAYLGHQDLKGQLLNGVLSFTSSKIQYVFALEDRVTAVLNAGKKRETVRTEQLPTYEQWAGDYYGSFFLSQGTGAWEGNSGESYDICGRISQEEGQGLLSLWTSYNKPGEAFCMADVIFTEGTTDFGKMYVQWGKLYDMEMGPGEWVVDPGKSQWSCYENLFYFRGSYMDPEDPGNTFTYEVFLRPWGTDWKDLESSETDSWILPPGYEDWYLPLQKAGQNMPDHF